MAYEKQTWSCGDEITADKLNHMEDGIADGGGEAMESIAYAELKAKRDNGELTPGMQYRITDYECTTTQEGTRAVAHSFDIIVVADDESTLNENARACLREGDTYYSASNHDANLEAWELKYSIDNDTDRFAWADTTNGKGVIYWLKDDKNNECPYDFKQIQFEVTASGDEGGGDEGGGGKAEGGTKSAPTLKAASGGDSSSGDDSTTSKWLYTFSIRDGEATEIVSEDASIAPQNANGGFIRNNIIRVLIGDGDIYGEFGKQYLNSITFDNLYELEHGTCCNSNTFGDGCYSNTFGDWCRSNTFGDGCYSNTFGNGCNSNTFGNECYFNTFGDECRSNTFGDRCYSNTFGDGCYSNTFGNGCNSNTFGNECYFNTFGDECRSNTFGGGCRSNTFGGGCRSNTFGDGCNSNTFGDRCNFINFFVGATTQNNRFYHVLDGTAGTSSSPLAISGTASNNYVTYVGKNSSGVLKTWIPADSVA